MIRYSLILLLLISPKSTAFEADDYTKELHELYCKSCHTTESSGAPQTHNVKVWTERIEDKALSGLVESSITGIGNMPPQGMCNECTAEDLTNLIKFMSSTAGSKD